MKTPAIEGMQARADRVRQTCRTQAALLAVRAQALPWSGLPALANTEVDELGRSGHWDQGDTTDQSNSS